MTKVDRLPWAAGIAFVVYGARIGVRVNDPAALELVESCLPPLARPLRSPVVDYLFSFRRARPRTERGRRDFHLLYGDGDQLSRTLEIDEARDALECSIQAQVGMLARRKLVVHAGVVRWRGQAILVPGRSMTGKSELVAALLRAGATYYSDEYAVLDGSARVHPYPKPLALRPKHRRPESPARVGARPAPVGLIVATEYRQGARWQPETLSPAQGVLALMENTLLARARPEATLPLLRQVAAGAKVLKGKRGEADAMAAVLLDEVAG